MKQVFDPTGVIRKAGLSVPPSGSGHPSETEPVPVSAQSVGVPDAYLTKMREFIAEARKEKLYTSFEFWLCPDLYRALSQDGERPTELYGAKLREVDTWSWGWMLMVGSPLFTRMQSFEPQRAFASHPRTVS